MLHCICKHVDVMVCINKETTYLLTYLKRACDPEHITFSVFYHTCTSTPHCQFWSN